jgi:superkiller protein 3
VSFFVFKTGLASFFYQRALTIGNEGEKTRLLLKAIDWDSNRAEYLVVLSQAMMAQGENILALASSQKATEVSPNQASTWENLGLVYQKLGSAPEAVDAFEKAVALEPTNPYLYFKIGQTYFEAGQKTEARENFIKSIQFKPDFETPRLYLGLIQDSDAK